jgi:PPM family protein phosphatase
MSAGEKSASRLEIIQEYASSATSVGGRELNEDSCISIVVDPDMNRWRISALLAVADGLGGHQAGDVASKIAVSLLEEVFVNENVGTVDGITFQTELSDVIEATIQSINERIYSYSESGDGHNMGTTLTVALVRESGHVVVGHVGDSRLYIIDGDGADQLTADHSPVGRLLSADIITEREAANREDRNIVDQALGTDRTVEVDVVEFDLHPGEIILLTTDGLSNVVFRDEIPAIVRHYRDARDVATGLVQVAVDRGTDDNATDAVLIVSGPEAAGLVLPLMAGLEEEPVVESHEAMAGQTVITAAPLLDEDRPTTSIRTAEVKRRRRDAQNRWKYRNLLIVFLMAVLVFSAAGVIVVVVGKEVTKKPKKPVPNVVGMTDLEASNRIRQNGFKVIREYDYNSSQKSGIVTKQNRVPKSLLTQGEQVGIIIAQQGLIPVPDLTGKTFDEAVSLLRDKKLKFERTNVDTDNQEKDGKVSSQDPGSDRKLDPGATVALVVFTYKPTEVAPQPTIPKPTTPKPTENWITCPTCGGSGQTQQIITENEQYTCPTCNGTGQRIDPDPTINGTTCPTCGGSGHLTRTVQKTISVTCPTCGGAGKIRQ